MYLISEVSDKSNFVDLSVPGWAWVALIGFIFLLLAFDILVIHRKAHDVGPREALIESAAWISLGVAFTGIIAWGFGGAAAGGLAGTRSPVVETPRPVALAHPFFFEGRCRSPRVVADLLLVLANTVNSRFYLPGAWRMLDPVVTSSEELLRLEGFSSCCGVYARVDLSAEAFDSEIQGRGTSTSTLRCGRP